MSTIGLLEESTLDLNYVVLILGSCAIATLGLLSNSAAVIIGAMIIAPLMLPIRRIAFAALEGSVVLLRRGQHFTLIFQVSQIEEVRRENLTQPDSEPLPSH